MVTHVAAPYAYRELPPLGSLVLRTELGADVLWGESSEHGGQQHLGRLDKGIRAGGLVRTDRRRGLGRCRACRQYPGKRGGQKGQNESG